MKQLVKSLSYILSISLIVFLLPINTNAATPTYNYEWVRQSGTISSDGLAHEYTNLSAGQTINLSLTLVNRSGITIVGKSNLSPSPDKQVPVGSWGIGSQTPYQDGTPHFLDLSSYVVNNNRFVYYTGPDVPNGQSMTMSWNIKLRNNLPDGVYNLYVRPVSEYLAWTRQVKNGQLLPTTSSDIFWRLTVGDGSSLSVPFGTQSLVYSYSVREDQGSSSCQNCSINYFSLYKFDPSTGINTKFYFHIQNKDIVEETRWGSSYARTLNNDLIHVIRRATSRSDNIVVNNAGETIMSGLERPESIISPDGVFMAYPQFISDQRADLNIKNLNTNAIKTYNVSTIPDDPEWPDSHYKSLFPIKWSLDSKTLYLLERYIADFGGKMRYKLYKINVATGAISSHYNSTSLNFLAGSISPTNGAIVGDVYAQEGMMWQSPSRIDYTYVDGQNSKTLVNCPDKICAISKISNKGDKFVYLDFLNDSTGQSGAYMFLSNINDPSSKIFIDNYVRNIYEWSADDRYIVYTRALNGSNPALIRVYDVWNKNIYDIPHTITDSTHESITIVGFVKQ